MLERVYKPAPPRVTLVFTWLLRTIRPTWSPQAFLKNMPQQFRFQKVFCSMLHCYHLTFGIWCSSTALDHAWADGSSQRRTCATDNALCTRPKQQPCFCVSIRLRVDPVHVVRYRAVVALTGAKIARNDNI